MFAYKSFHKICRLFSYGPTNFKFVLLFVICRTLINNLHSAQVLQIFFSVLNLLSSPHLRDRKQLHTDATEWLMDVD